MKLTHRQTIIKNDKGISSPGFLSKRITSLCFSPDNQHLFVATADRIVTIYDDGGGRVDRFNTKPNGDGPKDYIISSMQFTPELSQLKLAVSQSDAIIYVYKWTVNDSENVDSSLCFTNGKKTICNKFPESSSVSNLIWHRSNPSQLFYGLFEGKVKLANLRTNKTQTLYTVESPLMTLATDIDGKGVLSGHLDGAIYRFMLPNGSTKATCSKIIQHHCVPNSISWGHSICITGDRNISFFDIDGKCEREFFYSMNDSSKYDMPICRDFTCASFNPSGNSVVVGNFDSYYLFSWDVNTNTWEKGPIYKVQNMCNISHIEWKPNGSSLAIGSTAGILDLYDAAYRTYTYRKAYEITYISPNQVLVQNKDSINASPFMIQSLLSDEIIKIRIHPEPISRMLRYIVAKGDKSILFYDMESINDSLTEIPWKTNDTMKEGFIFDAPNACIINNAGELSIIEYGANEILWTFRTEYTASNLLSLRLNEYPRKAKESMKEGKTVAYLIDEQTICVKNLITMMSSTVTFSTPIDFLELNTKGNFILFRDKQRVLHLLDIKLQSRITLLSECRYVQWVPGCDVVVAQSNNQMFVWYNIHAVDQITIREINGEISGIERAGGKTEVLVNEQSCLVPYTLSEQLILFGSALEDRNYTRCVEIMDKIQLSSKSRAMWQQLLSSSIRDRDLITAERSAAALGNLGRARYIRHLRKLCGFHQNGFLSSKDGWIIEAKLNQLDKDLQGAENLYLFHTQVEEAIEMYEELNMFFDALRVAGKCKYPKLEKKKVDYLQLLISKQQDDIAAKLKELDGNFVEAITLYLNAGFVGKSASVIMENNITQPSRLIESVATALVNLRSFQQSGKLFERVSNFEKALSCYLQGNAFEEAVNLARSQYPEKVVSLKEAWADHLMSLGQSQRSIEHFLEALNYKKALIAAIDSESWDQAADIARDISDETAYIYIDRIVKYYSSKKQLEDAEFFLLKMKKYADIVSMYIRHDLFEAAESIAKKFLTIEDRNNIYIDEASNLSEQRNFQKAERLYIIGNNPGLAIEMYTNCGMYEEALSVASSYRGDLVEGTSNVIAAALESQGRVDDAEKYYSTANNWLAAVNMYRKRDLWDDALRVAEAIGGLRALKKTAYAYSLYLGDEEGYRVLSMLGLVEYVVEFAIEVKAFDVALKYSQNSDSRRRDIHLKHAKYLQDIEQFENAEQEFINAEKIDEAIEMYIDNNLFQEAYRVAKRYDESYLPRITCSQAENALNEGDYRTAEQLFIDCGKVDMALKMYKEANKKEDAFRVANKYGKDYLDELESYWTKKNVNERRKYEEHFVYAKHHENSGRINEAMNAYLLQLRRCENENEIDNNWENLLRIIEIHCPERLVEMAKEVSRYLCDLGYHKKASDILYSVEALEEAVDILTSIKNWAVARQYASGRNDLLRIVESKYKNSINDDQNITAMMRSGDFRAAMDILVSKGEWETLLGTKEFMEQSFAVDFILKRVSILYEEFDDLSASIEVIKIFSQSIIPTLDYNIYFDLYMKVTCSILGCNQEQEKAFDQLKILLALKRILQRALNQYRQNCFDEDESSMDKTSYFIHLLMAVHYIWMVQTCSKYDLNDIACKSAISLLRYSAMNISSGNMITIIPADKVFFIAGNLCRETDNNHLAFMFLNRYIELSEAFEESEFSHLMNKQFEGTVLPFDTNSFRRQYIQNYDLREEVREWVLSACVDPKNQLGLPLDRKGTIYEGLFESDSPLCTVTGFPIPDDCIMKTSKYKANKYHYDLFIEKLGVCPWTGDEL